MSDALVIAGLIVNMTGVCFAFFVGFPQQTISRATGHTLLLEDAPDQSVIDVRLRKRRRLSYVGLSLLLVGFGLQLAGVLVGL